uniref:DNA replication licensing factor MCM5 n=1 Tax=Tetraodon nigroviridis TaxID=99883 RepID=H3CL83_TETNG
MSGFDDPGVYYSESFGGGEAAGQDEGGLKRIHIKKRFREFIRQFRVGTDRTGFTYKYRDELKRHYTMGEFWVEVEMEDLASFDEDLSDCLYKMPTENLPLLEEAAKEVADEVTRPRPTGEEMMQDIQVMLKSDAHHASIRSLKSDQVSHLVKVHGIIISATAVKAKATKVCLQCRGCRNIINNIPLPPGLQGYALPRKCNVENAGRMKCPVDPYFIIPDRCVCIDFQTLRLQESPDAVPHGEMPRHLQLYCDRYLCDRVVPGNRVTIMGIYSIKKVAAAKAKGKERNAGVGLRSSYLRVVGIQVDTEGAGDNKHAYILGNLRSRETFRSALPHFTLNTCPVAVSLYKEVGGAGQTMSQCVLRHLRTKYDKHNIPSASFLTLRRFCNIYGTVIDKSNYLSNCVCGLVQKCCMRAKLANECLNKLTMTWMIVDILCFYLMNPLRHCSNFFFFNVDTKICLSLIPCSALAFFNYIVRLTGEYRGSTACDRGSRKLARVKYQLTPSDSPEVIFLLTLARHVMNVHLSAQTQTEGVEGEIPLPPFKKYIAYARAKCGPPVSAAASEKLKNRYVLMRTGAREHERETDKRPSIPITVRQLEAVVRIAESLAKMKLQAVAGEEEVDEALRLFQVSTLDAALSGNLSG